MWPITKQQIRKICAIREDLAREGDLMCWFCSCHRRTTVVAVAITLQLLYAAIVTGDVSSTHL